MGRIELDKGTIFVTALFSLAGVQIVSFFLTQIFGITFLNVWPAFVILFLTIAMITLWRISEIFFMGRGLSKQEVFMILIVFGLLFALYLYVPEFVPTIFENGMSVVRMQLFN